MRFSLPHFLYILSPRYSSSVGWFSVFTPDVGWLSELELYVFTPEVGCLSGLGCSLFNTEVSCSTPVMLSTILLSFWLAPVL